MGWQIADRPGRTARARQWQPNLDQALALAKAVVAVGAAVLYGVVWVGYEEFYGGLDLSPEDIGIGQATIVSRAAVALGLVAAPFASCVGFGIVAFRLSRPILARRPGSEPRLSYWSKVLGANLVALFIAVVLPVGLLAMVANGPGGAAIVPLVISIGGLALEVSLILNDPEVALGNRLSRVRQWLYPGRGPRVGVSLACSLIGVVLVAWAWNFLSDAAYAGRALRSSGVLPTEKVHFLNVGVAPARIRPKGADVAGVCEGETKAVLLRRRDDVAFVLVMGGDRPEARSEVVPLRESEYSVVAAVDAERACSPRAP